MVVRKSLRGSQALMVMRRGTRTYARQGPVKGVRYTSTIERVYMHYERCRCQENDSANAMQ